MSEAARVTLEPWDEHDLHVLERSNTPDMTRYLGGPETREQLLDRQKRYLTYKSSREARMLRIDVDGVAAGSIGYWCIERDSVAAYETGWGVLPEWQGRGVAKEALRQIIRLIAAEGDRSLLYAFPGVDNPASNALCRGAGFEHRGSETAPWRGSELTFNVWVLDLSSEPDSN